MTSAEEGTFRAWPGIAAVAVVAALGSLAALAFVAADERLAVLSLVLGGSVLLALVLQLATRRKVGFVDRVTASVVGAVIPVAIAAAATGIVLLVAG